MLKKYQIFSLENAVSDVTRIEVLYDEWSFVINKYDSSESGDKAVFNTEEEAVIMLEKILKDYNRRNIEDARFIILPVYFTNIDRMFNPKQP
jgi:hypothetical protein